MLSFDRASLESKAARVDGHLTGDDPVWEEGDPRPAGPVHVTGRLSSAGDDRYYFSGRLEGQMNAECRRCLADVSVPVNEELQLLFADAGDEETDDTDVYLLDPRAHELDLRPALREQWLLSVPAFSLCREDCKGLCTRCGADLNQGPCDCEPEIDSRWKGLREARSDS
jgi:DUF177 domain-containing protein